MSSKNRKKISLNWTSEKTEPPCYYPNRSLTLPWGTGKMSACAPDGLLTYVHAWVAGGCACVHPWPMSRRLWQAGLLTAVCGLCIRELIILWLQLTTPHKRTHTATYPCMHITDAHSHKQYELILSHACGGCRRTSSDRNRGGLIRMNWTNSQRNHKEES